MAAPGDLDPSFGTGGLVTTNWDGTSRDAAIDVTIDAGGREVVVGASEGSFLLARYDDHGVLDPTFGTGGKVRQSFAAYASPEAVAIDSGGRIVVVGGQVNTDFTTDFLIARFNTDGSLDTSFGGDGSVVTDFNEGGDDGANGVAIDSSGRIDVVGTSWKQPSGPRDFALARYLANGDLDTSFGTAGKVLTTFEFGEAADVAIDSSGRIIAVGRSVSDENNAFTLARYENDGDLDPSFGNAGTVVTDFGPGLRNFAALTGVELDSSGGIVVAGSIGNDFALARYATSGTLDPSFGEGGVVRTHISTGTFDSANDIAIDPYGRIVLAGLGAGTDTHDYDFVVARYRASGRIDAGFGTQGGVTTDFASNSSDVAFGVAIDSSGRIVAAGYSDHSGLQFAIARYLGGPNPPQPTLRVVNGGSGTGTVTSSPAGIDCGQTCEVDLSPGTQVVLTASSGGSTQPVQWTGCDSVNASNQCLVTLSSDRDVTATFNLIEHQLSVSKSGTGSGTVTSSPPGINCGGACSAQFNDGTTVTLVAAASSGSTFSGWSGCDASSGAQCTVTMSAAKSVSAAFTQDPPPPPPPPPPPTLPPVPTPAPIAAAPTENPACAVLRDKLKKTKSKKKKRKIRRQLRQAGC